MGKVDKKLMVQIHSKVKSRLFFRKSDFLVVGLVLSLAFALWGLKLARGLTAGNEARVAEIYQENQLLAKLPLAQLQAGSYRLADLLSASLEAETSSPSPGQTGWDSPSTDQDSYHIGHYLFEADGQGGFKISQAPCPDQLCQRGGYLSQAGDLSICVPGQVLVKITGTGESDQETGSELDVVIGQGQNSEN